MEDVIRRSFVLNDTATRLQLIWHAGSQLPDLKEASIVAARVTKTGYEWATAQVSCPHCHRAFRVSRHTRSASAQLARTVETIKQPAQDVRTVKHEPIEHLFLSEESLSLLQMFGNVSIDARIKIAVDCPHCGRGLQVTMSAQQVELVVRIDDECVAAICPDGGKVLFRPGGIVGYESPSSRWQPRTDAGVFLELPGVVGTSREGKDLLRRALCVRSSSLDDSDQIDLLDFALRHRFKGYDARFYAQAKQLCLTYGASIRVVLALFDLPHEFSIPHIMHLFKQSGLPNRASVLKAAGQNLVSLALFAKFGLGGLCGGDPNLAVRLLTSKTVDAVWFDALLNDYDEVSGLVRLAMQEEQSTYLVNRLMKLDSHTVATCVNTYEKLRLDCLSGLMTYRAAREHVSFTAIVKDPWVLDAYRQDIRSAPLRYGPDAALQGEYDGFRFELPRKMGRFAEAGVELKNCLGQYAETVAMGDTLVFLVSKGSRLVAAVEMRPIVKEVRQMFAKANRRIAITEDLGMAIARWAKDKGLDLSGRMFA